MNPVIITEPCGQGRPKPRPGYAKGCGPKSQPAPQTLTVILGPKDLAALNAVRAAHVMSWTSRQARKLIARGDDLIRTIDVAWRAGADTYDATVPDSK